jgi:hypothetical protein
MCDESPKQDSKQASGCCCEDVFNAVMGKDAAMAVVVVKAEGIKEMFSKFAGCCPIPGGTDKERQT